MPMWFRGPDMRLRLVNCAYVAAVGAKSADQVVDGQIELVESIDGLTAAQVADQARKQGLPIERIVTPRSTGSGGPCVSATCRWGRGHRRLRDRYRGHGRTGARIPRLPRSAALHARPAFGRASPSSIDKRVLTFANQPFQRIFALPAAMMLDPPDFDRLLDHRARCPAYARSAGLSGMARANSAGGFQPDEPRRKPGRFPTARICGSSPSRCRTAGW